MNKKPDYPKFSECRENFDALLLAASKRNNSRSKSDRRQGLAPPEDCDLREHLRTVEFAIEAGLKTGDTQEIFEAYDMLKTAIRRINHVTPSIHKN